MSLRRKIYYHLKPLLPFALRVTVRRWFAKRKLRQCQDIWPIKPGTEKPPVGWPGWPDGKQFAVVLTHDVEGPVGLQRIKPLIDLEMRLGFRSCYNLIPEGSYQVTQELRDHITSRGFEVGVHDLYHDGKLFSSRKNFRQCAPRINHYLKEWGVVGFRAGFMHHNLDWIHDLHVQYDCSTFDTDPFEPQPEGVDTIFPFWVPRPQNEELRTTNQEPRLGSSLSAPGSAPSALRSAPTPDLGPRTSDFPPLSAPGSALSALRSAPTSDLRPRTSDLRPPLGYVELPYTLPQDSTLFSLFNEPGIDLWRRKLDWVAQHGGMVLVNVHPDYLYFEVKKSQSEFFPVTHYETFLRYIAQRYAANYWQAIPSEVAERLKPVQVTL